MTIELINVGALPNDGTGDPLRVAFNKINNNFLTISETGTANGPDGSIQFRSQNKLLSIAQANDLYLAVGYPNRTFISTDNEIWTSVDSGLGITLNKVISTDVGFLAVGNSGLIASSLNATSWTVLDSGVDVDLISVARHPSSGLLVAVGVDGTIITSPNGAVWTTRNSTTTEKLNDIVYTNSTWVAVGDNDTVLYSANATTWVPVTIGDTVNYNAVAFQNSYYYVVGDNGVIYASTDLIQWNQRVTTSSDNFNSILAATIDSTDTLVIVGDNGAVLTSEDGINWAIENVSITYNLNSVVYLTDKVFTVGDNGVVLVSTVPTSWINNSVPGTLEGNISLTYDVATSNLQFAGNIVPVSNSTSKLGDQNLRLHSSYFSSNGVHIGNVAARANGNTFSISTTGNANVLVDVVAANATFGNTVTANFYIGDGRYLSNVVAAADPAGSNTQVQFNDSNSLGASANFTYDKVTDTLTVGTINAAIAGTIKVPFDYTMSNVIVGNIPAGSIVSSINAIITTPFDDNAAYITVGTTLTPDSLLTQNDTQISGAGTYGVLPATKYSVQTEIVLYVTPLSSTAGEGLLIFNYE